MMVGGRHANPAHVVLPASSPHTRQISHSQDPFAYAALLLCMGASTQHPVLHGNRSSSPLLQRAI